MSTNDSRPQRKDPIFQLETPLLFAHRGGAREAPESTEEAFRYAVEQRADVLELDVQLTRDGEIVVWHGPELDKVRGRSRRYTKRDLIGDFYWRQLRDKVWVVHPTQKPYFRPVPRRRLLLLSDFFILVDKIQRQLGSRRKLHLNIELKSSSRKARDWKNEHLKKLLKLVDKHSENRTIILASMNRRRLVKLRNLMKEQSICHPTNLAISELLAWTVRGWSLANRAYETFQAQATKKLVQKVHRAGGSFYVFITGRLVGIEHKSPKALKKRLFELLDMGVDGIMTDYPKKVGALMREWKRNAQ